MAKNYTARPPGLKNIRLDLTPEYHLALRQLAAAANRPMSKFAREVMEREIDRRTKAAARDNK